MSIYISGEEYKKIEEILAKAKEANPNISKNVVLRNILRRGLGLEPIETKEEKMAVEIIAEYKETIDRLQSEINDILEALKDIGKRLRTLEKKAGILSVGGTLENLLEKLEKRG